MTDEKTTSPTNPENLHKLHLGRLVPPKGSPDPPTSLLINFQQLCHHGAILAQSGAGKSTLIGRLVEEILLKTTARVIVVDANGDFRKAHLVAGTDGKEGKVWTDQVSPPGDNFDRVEFEKQWRKLTKIYLAKLSQDDAAAELKRIVPCVTWNKLPLPWQMEVLDLELNRHPDEVAALYRVAKRLEDENDKNVLISPRRVSEEVSLLASTSTDINRLSKETAVRLQTRLQQTAKLDLWRDEADQADLPSSIKERPRLLVLDIPSVADPKAANILVAHFLEEVWNEVRRDWDKAVANPEEDQRRPTFLVVDEAHNFVPTEDPVEPLPLRISRSIQRIAAEGRKYGLFLLIATQRPPKVRQGFLSECENVCLLRLQSTIDRDIAINTWGLRQHKSQVKSIAEFDRGEGLLCGHWANRGVVHFNGANRRTKETGGNLSDDWIIER